MAKSDVREYLYTMLQQYLEMKNDLKEFDQAFKDGYITEDKLEEIKMDVARLRENYDRLVYICYLLDLPNRSKKKEKFKAANKDIEDYMTDINASEAAVIEENKCILNIIKQRLKTLTENSDKANQ